MTPDNLWAKRCATWARFLEKETALNGWTDGDCAEMTRYVFCDAPLFNIALIAENAALGRGVYSLIPNDFPIDKGIPFTTYKKALCMCEKMGWTIIGVV